MKVKIYLASRFTSRARLSKIREILESYDFEITSHWLNDSDDRPEPGGDDWPEHCTPRAIQDVEDVISAHIVVVDVLDGLGRRGGQWSELGISLGLMSTQENRYCIVVGDTDNVFVYHPLVIRTRDWNEARLVLEDIRVELQKSEIE